MLAPGQLIPQVGAYISAEIENLIKRKMELKGKKILGVHARGTDFKRNYNGHPIAVTAQEYLAEAKNLVETGEYDRIFLATDDTNAVRLFRNEFGSKILYYDDVTRGEGNETVMKSDSTRDDHHYKLGLEVLRDMYTLASCDGLVAGLSQVSFAARIQKFSWNQQYVDLKILDKGINYHRANNCPR